MEVKLYFNHSEKNKVNKELTNEITLNGAFRDSIELLKPVILFESNNFPNCNYCYIPEFDRYFFIDKIEVVRTGLWLVICKVDVLMTYKDEIKELNVILADTENTGSNKYLDSDVWVSTVKTKTDILNFSNGLSESGHFILITAGG